MILPIKFYVAGKPEPAGSKRGFVVNGRAIITDANKNSKPWQQQVKFVARDNYKGPILEGPLVLRIDFYTIRPKAHYRSGKNAHLLRENAPQAPTSKPDCTKLTRGVEDALTAILWKDDAQIVSQHIFKSYAESYGAEITVYPWDASVPF